MLRAASLAAVVLAFAGSQAGLPSFPGDFVTHGPVDASVVQRECPSLGNEMFDKDAAELGACGALGLHDVGSAGGQFWRYGTYERRWLLAPKDTVVEREVVLFKTSSRDQTKLQPLWHYHYEAAILASAKPAVRAVAGGALLLAVDECVNGTGGCSQSFVILKQDKPTPVTLAFLDSLERRFPGGIRHGFHVDLRTLRGSLALYSGNDANCCPSTIGEFTVRLRGTSLALATLQLRRPD